MYNDKGIINSSDTAIVRLVKDTWSVAHGYQDDPMGRTPAEQLRDFADAMIIGDPTGTAQYEEKIADLEWSKEEAEAEKTTAEDETARLRDRCEEISIELTKQLDLVAKVADKIGAAFPSAADLLAELQEAIDGSGEWLRELENAAKD